MFLITVLLFIALRIKNLTNKKYNC